MTKRSNLWQAWTLSQAYNKLPSEVYKLSKKYDDWTCFQFDNAIAYFGRWIDARLNEIDDKGKPRHQLKDLLRDTPQTLNEWIVQTQNMSLKGLMGKGGLRKMS